MHHAARNLRPLDSLDGQPAQALGPEFEAGAGDTGQFTDEDLSTIADACASHVATCGSLKSGEMDSVPSPALVRCYHQPLQEREVDPSSLDLLSVAVPSEPDSLLVEPAQSVISTEPKASFRFAAPKLFVGKLAHSASMSRRASPVKVSSRGRKKQSQAGRTDIRTMPNYHDDPIEEFDEVNSVQGLPLSLFRGLETD